MNDNGQPRIKTIKLTGEALQHGKRVAGLMREFEMARELIKERHAKEYKVLCDMHVRAIEDVFKKIKALTGVPDNKDYRLDVEYLEDHGDIFMSEFRRKPDQGDMIDALVEKLLLNPKEH